MAIQTRAQKASEKDAATAEETTKEEPPPNRAARRLAAKQEQKDAKEAKLKATKSSKSGSSSSRNGSSSKTRTSKVLNPKTTSKEFGGVIGAAAMIICLPILVLSFAYGCNREAGYYPFHRLYDTFTNFNFSVIKDSVSNWSYGGAVVYLAIVLQLGVYSMVLPGEEIEGPPLRDGTKLKYKINAMATFQSFLMMTVMALRGQGSAIFVWIKEHFSDIVLFGVVFSFIVSIGVYAFSFVGNKMLALGGNTGNHIYDFMIGRELNPRIGKFDIKFFAELRPGLIMWMSLNAFFALYQYTELGRFTYSMILVNVFQGWYVIDALINEPAVLTTMDMTTDGFGFMLAFGNLCWVPFMYSLQARYLADFPIDLPLPALAGIVALQLFGYYIFRSANNQKDTFRKNPNDPKVADLKYIQTKAGTRLMTSGWWGTARHINYLGDWLMSVAWCLPCGFNSIIPYFYCVYFAILLIHRERRDEEKCRNKYGSDWDRYCSIVKYRIIPYVY
ncbi:ERG4/ERG24 ergosterol biosynthesis protein [Backusella circina FSU 941]|nr:ERG4/ERG24 ergosterol biosynthesis protein [Backusella circina FSU 941]